MGSQSEKEKKDEEKKDNKQSDDLPGYRCQSAKVNMVDQNRNVTYYQYTFSEALREKVVKDILDRLIGANVD